MYCIFYKQGMIQAGFIVFFAFCLEKYCRVRKKRYLCAAFEKFDPGSGYEIKKRGKF